MSIESWTASLHAGLIQRARPAAPKIVPLREREPFGRTTATPLREGAMARARVSSGRSPETGDAHQSERAHVAPQAMGPESRGWSFRPRFGLTVRVHAGLRELLFDARSRTGRTTQSILHDALVQYLHRLDREQGQR